MKKLSLIFSIFIISSFLVFSVNAADAGNDWIKDYQIDEKLGLAGGNWDIPFAEIKILNDFTQRVEKKLPPYSQQPEKAQNIISTPSGDTSSPPGAP